jgi:hypothetical protein
MVRKKRRNVERRNRGRSRTVRRKERGRGGRGKKHSIREGTQAKKDAKKILEVSPCRCCLIKKGRGGGNMLEDNDERRETERKRVPGKRN